MGIYVVLESEEAHKAHKAFVRDWRTGFTLSPRAKYRWHTDTANMYANLSGVCAERLKQANCPLVAQPSRAAYPLNGLKSVSMTSPPGQKQKEQQ